MCSKKKKITESWINLDFNQFFVDYKNFMGVSGKSEVCGSLCQCQSQLNGSNTNKSSKNSSGGDNLFSPIKKMKVLKKIKKRIGLGRLSAMICTIIFVLKEFRFMFEKFVMKSEWRNCMIRQLVQCKVVRDLENEIFSWPQKKKLIADLASLREFLISRSAVKFLAEWFV